MDPRDGKGGATGPEGTVPVGLQGIGNYFLSRSMRPGGWVIGQDSTINTPPPSLYQGDEEGGGEGEGWETPQVEETPQTGETPQKGEKSKETQEETGEEERDVCSGRPADACSGDRNCRDGAPEGYGTPQSPDVPRPDTGTHSEGWNTCNPRNLNGPEQEITKYWEPEICQDLIKEWEGCGYESEDQMVAAIKEKIPKSKGLPRQNSSRLQRLNPQGSAEAWVVKTQREGEYPMERAGRQFAPLYNPDRTRNLDMEGRRLFKKCKSTLNFFKFCQVGPKRLFDADGRRLLTVYISPRRDHTCESYMFNDCWSCWTMECKTCWLLYSGGSGRWGPSYCDECKDFSAYEWEEHTAHYVTRFGSTHKDGFTNLHSDSICWIIIYDRHHQDAGQTKLHYNQGCWRTLLEWPRGAEPLQKGVIYSARYDAFEDISGDEESYNPGEPGYCVPGVRPRWPVDPLGRSNIINVEVSGMRASEPVTQLLPPATHSAADGAPSASDAGDNGGTPDASSPGSRGCSTPDLSEFLNEQGYDLGFSHIQPGEEGEEQLYAKLQSCTLEDASDGDTQQAGGATTFGYDLYSDIESAGGDNGIFHLDKYGAPFGVGQDWGHYLTWAGEDTAEGVMDNNGVMANGPGNDAKDEGSPQAMAKIQSWIELIQLEEEQNQKRMGDVQNQYQQQQAVEVHVRGEDGPGRGQENRDLQCLEVYGGPPQAAAATVGNAQPSFQAPREMRADVEGNANNAGPSRATVQRRERRRARKVQFQNSGAAASGPMGVLGHEEKQTKRSKRPREDTPRPPTRRGRSPKRAKGHKRQAPRQSDDCHQPGVSKNPNSTRSYYTSSYARTGPGRRQ